MGRKSVDDSVIIAFKVSSVSWITLLNLAVGSSDSGGRTSRLRSRLFSERVASAVSPSARARAFPRHRAQHLVRVELHSLLPLCVLRRGVRVECQLLWGVSIWGVKKTHLTRAHVQLVADQRKGGHGAGQSWRRTGTACSLRNRADDSPSTGALALH
jgi:hypothetical protein